MSQPEVEEFELDLPPGDTLFQRTHLTIERDRARTGNLVAVTLVFAIVLALPVTFITLALFQPSDPKYDLIFDRWLTAVGPLVGLAVGFYFGSHFNYAAKHGGRE